MGLLIPLFCSFTTGFYLIRFFITLYYWGGFHQWGSPVQSLEAFALCGLPISLGSYAYLHILWKMLAQVLVTGFFFAVFSVVRERKFSYLISGAALLFEYIAYTKIPSSSMLGILTWFNLFALLDPYQSIGVYQNLNFFGTALGNTAVVMIFALAMFLTGAVMLLYSQKAQYPIMDTGKWVYNFRKIVPKIKKPRLSSAWLLEGKKLYLLQKGLVLLFILALIQGYRIERQMQFYSVSEQFQLQYYEEYGGVPTEEKMQLAQKETDRLEEQIQGAVTDVERKSWMDQKAAFDIVYTELQRIWMLKQEGNNVELINPEGYERLMNWEGSLVSDMLLCIAWILLFSLGSWYRERQNGMIELLRPSNKGLGYVQRMKMSWTAIYSLIAFGLVFGVRIKNILYRFPITGLTASVKSLFWMESNSGPLWMYLVGNYIFLYGGISVIWITGLILAYLCFLKKTG